MLKDSRLHLKNTAAELRMIANRLPNMTEARDVTNAAEKLREWASFLQRVAADMTVAKVGKTRNWQDTD
jgi:hypothetical protein